MKDKVLDFDKGLSEISEDLQNTGDRADTLSANLSETSALSEEIMHTLGIQSDISNTASVDLRVTALETEMNDILSPELRGNIHLSGADVAVSIIAGIIAAVVDIVFIGTPEVVKVYKSGERFDGSIFTALLRKIGNGDDRLSHMLKWLSEKCKVPYDISARKGIVDPNNHRLRCFAHDPMLGLLFAVVDIIMGTATLIDDNGKIVILINDKSYPPEEKLFAAIYYFGHLLSDVCTARGLPIPGFFMTQFLADPNNDTAIARIAEQMYKDGYDLRHLVSMSSAVAIKDMLIDLYLKFCSTEINPVESIATAEIDCNRDTAMRYRLRIISDVVACGGNIVKFFIPPTMGNMTALNLPEWISLLKDTIANIKYERRDKGVELVIGNRELIDDRWGQLMIVE